MRARFGRDVRRGKDSCPDAVHHSLLPRLRCIASGKRARPPGFRSLPSRLRAGCL